MVARTVVACSDSASTVPEGDEDAWPTVDSLGRIGCYYEVELDLPDGVTPLRAAATRAEETVDESALTALDIFVVSLNGDQEDWGSVQHLTIPADRLSEKSVTDGDAEKKQWVAQTHFYVPLGRVHVYVGANLRSELVEAFCQGTNRYAAPSTDNYAAVIAHFVDANKGIAMFSNDVKTMNVSQMITGEMAGSQTNPLIHQVTLRRMVAKVLLTCDEAATSGYVKLKSQTSVMLSGDDVTTFVGWCRLDDIRYKLQCTNRATYFVQKDSAGTTLDPNYYLSDLIRWDGEQVTYRPERDTEFVYLGTDHIYDFSTQGVSRTIAKYVSDDATQYTGGFYCLENTCDNAWGRLESNLSTALAFWRMAPTHVLTSLVVRARYTPAVIYSKACFPKDETTDPVTYNATDPVTCNSETVAQELLIAESADKTKAEATFYCINGRYCYTYEGMLACIEYAQAREQQTGDKLLTSDRKNYQEFTNGYCYYQEYFDDLNLAALDQTRFEGVLRNNYYLLHCSLVTAPTTSEKSLEVMSVALDWQDWKPIKTTDNVFTIQPDDME